MSFKDKINDILSREPDWQNIYSQAQTEFREYTGTSQELPSLEITEGSVFNNNEEPEYLYAQEPTLTEDMTEEEIEEAVYEHTDSLNTLKRKELENEENRKVTQIHGQTLEEPPVNTYTHLGIPEDFENTVDRENYTVKIGREDLKQYETETVQDLMKAGIKLHTEKALEESFQPVKEKILNQYKHLNPEIHVKDFYFEDFGDMGGYGFGNEKFTMGLDYIDEIDFKQGKIRDQRLESMMYHEGIHSMQNNTNPVFKQYIDGLGKRGRESNTDEAMGVNRAFMEAATTFETMREYGEFEGERERNQEVRTAWENGLTGLQKFAEENPEKIKENEYVMGQHAASTVHRMNQNKFEDSEEALKQTRNWLVHGVTTTNGLAGTVINAFEQNNMEAPQVLQSFKSYRERVPPEERNDVNSLEDILG